MSKARELAELSRTVSDSADAVAITIDSNENVTFASDIAVTGTVTATDLTLSDGTNPTLTITDTTNTTTLSFVAGNLSTTIGTTTNHPLTFDTNNTERLRIDGATGNVGISTGASSPSTKLHLGGTAPGDSIIRQDSTASGTNWEIGEREAGKWQIFEDDTDSVVATFTSSGQILQGITTIPTGVQSSRQFISSSATGAEIIAYREDNGVAVNDFCGAFLIGNDDNSGTEDHFAGMWGQVSTVSGNMDLKFAAGRENYESGSPHITLDYNGNLLVGTTDTAPGVGNTNTGGAFGSNGYGVFSRTGTAGQATAYFNKNTNDGEIIKFNKDGLTVGSIASEGGDALVIQSGSTSGSGLHFHPTSALIRPARNGATVDAVLNLGAGTRRFKDLFLSGGAYLGGTAAVNKLDSYEEGTFTPSSYSGWNTDPTSWHGKYTKVGDMVTLYVQITGGAFNHQCYAVGLPYSETTSGTSVVISGSITNVADVMVASGNRLWFRANNGQTSDGSRFSVTYRAS